MTKVGKLPRNTLIAMIILIAALSGGLYFFFVDRPVRTGIRKADEERTSIESRLSLLKARAENVSGVSDEVENLAASGQQSWMPSYNSEEAELDMLHTLLDSRTSDYQLSFENVTRDGNQIRRGCSLSFTTDSYQTAKDILYRLNHGQFRCLISSTSVSGITPGEASNGVHVTLSAMFYETMVGGEPDMGLAEGDRGKAVDPMEIGLSALPGMPSGISENLETVKGFISDEPSYSSLDDVMEQADGG